MTRHYSLLDYLCLAIDQGLRIHFPAETSLTPDKPVSEATLQETAPPLTKEERHRSACLMRVNHAGEICAQALYHGQAITAKSTALKTYFYQAAIEESTHLQWCQQRLVELGSHTSYLAFIWYGGSLCIGMVVGAVSDRYSLGFVAETEHQVNQHLVDQISRLPSHDQKSRAILAKMRAEEARHEQQALEAGASPLPEPVKTGMRLTAKVMVHTAYWI